MKRVLSLLGLARKSGQLISGFTNCLYAIDDGRAKLIIIAGDAGTSRKKVINACDNKQVPFLVLGKRDDLQTISGRPTSFIAVLSPELAQGLLPVKGSAKEIDSG